MQQLKPKPNISHTNQAAFVHKDLMTFRHVFVSRDSVHHRQQVHYNKPLLVKKRNEKLFKVKVNINPSTISIDRVKPVVLPNTDSGITPRATILQLDISAKTNLRSFRPSCSLP
ncbi:hypothetical protein NPIL_300981 [Nephila pilipes]|uniref:Uncharacterized protein n=1 Tax=Nephila pilipes TaxID=299642 RepID=A0A8X6QYS0_NEPPI|nr:hypothetical protein NPIL_300981 [Nephila pilipes]